MLVLSRKQKAHVLIHNAAAVAAGVGAGWLAELWPIPDVVPLSILQAGMVTALGALFVLQPVKSLLFGLLGAFAASLLGRGLALWLFSRLPEDEVAINVAVAAMLTEALGWGTYRLLLSLRPRLGRPSLVVQALEATRHGPFRVLFCSAPMLAAVLGALLVFNVRHRAEIRLRAPLGSVPLVFEYPLIERLEGTLQLSGTPRGASERVYMPVRNNQLAAELDEKILVRPAPMVRMHALVPVGASRFHVIDRDWQVEVRPGSDYWERVRGRLYLLLLGLLGALAMLWLGQHRSRAI